MSDGVSTDGISTEGRSLKTCPACGEVLETPLGCQECGTLLPLEDDSDPFAVFGLERAWPIDKKDLKRRLLDVQRIVHPDFHGTAPPHVRELAEASGARVNGAYEILLDDFLRADWLVRDLGGPSSRDERTMPQEFLMDVLEWNEELDEAESSPPDSAERDALSALAHRLLSEHDERLAAAGARLDPLPEPGSPVLTEVRRDLNAVRYLSRTLLRIRDLRFGPGSS